MTIIKIRARKQGSSVWKQSSLTKQILQQTFTTSIPNEDTNYKGITLIIKKKINIRITTAFVLL